MFSKLKERLLYESSQECMGNVEETVRNIPLVRGKDAIQSVKREFADFKLLMENHTVNDDATCWDWFCGKLAYFKERKLDQQYFEEMAAYAIINFPEQYVTNFESFMKIVEKVSHVTAVCTHLLRENRVEEALTAAKRCMTYLKERTGLYENGQLCFSTIGEAVLYAAEKGNGDEKRADDNYTAFFLCYAKILLMHAALCEELREYENNEIGICLDYAEKLSPCNASLWELRSRTYRESDRKRYMDCIRKALLYSIPDSENDVLGEIYTNLASYYSSQNYALSEALCTLSRKYGGDPGSVEFIIGGCHYNPYPDAELAIHQAGIQVGYSSLSRMAAEKAKEYHASVGNGECEDKGRKVILSASDSAYQYEVRDPMTIVGRSSAMSEYLKMKPTVSRVHARLVKEDDQLFVSDMDAMNGTYVNGIRIGKHRQALHEGDELRLGSSSVRGARFTVKTSK